VFHASYGLNFWLGSAIDPSEVPANRGMDAKGAGRTPVFFDSASMYVSPQPHDAPRQLASFAQQIECHGLQADSLGTMSSVTLNRHAGGINMVFMDWAVRKVGLKEPWTLKWHPEFDNTGPWTKTGGALPEDWPPWMRGFRDY
jgi:prepilin-type processing-associated H-X9-DG protein